MRLALRIASNIVAYTLLAAMAYFVGYSIIIFIILAFQTVTGAL